MELELMKEAISYIEENSDDEWVIVLQPGSPLYEYWWNDIFGNCSYGL